MRKKLQGCKKKGPMDYKHYNEKDFPPHLPKLNRLYNDLFDGGKGFRSWLIQKVAGPLGLKRSTTRLLCQTVEFIHNASLLHDDLVDRSTMRRGKTAAWLKYTPEYAVLAGDYLLARVMTNLSAHGNIKLIQLTSQTISELLEGEWMQDSLVGDFNLSLDRLSQVHSLKTSSLFRWCLLAPFVVKYGKSPETSPLLHDLGTTLGLLFQRSDDLLDYDVRNREGKAILGDIKSGYLNSFGAFFSTSLSEERREKLKNIKSLGEIHGIVGEKEFKTAIKNFDQLNGELIELYHHKLNQLAQNLEGKEQRLKEHLKPLPDALYWRQKPKVSFWS